MTAVAAPAPFPNGPSNHPTAAVTRPTSSSSKSETPVKRDAVDDNKKDVEENAKDTAQRPPPQPHITSRSNLAMEPNPFEQSFSNSHSNSSASDRSPPRGTEATSTAHNALPPLSSLTSPAAADPSQFPWLANHSLRSGSLSPAMLPGPQAKNGPPNNVSLRNGSGDAAPDGSFHTGFTPGGDSEFTPGYNSLMNATNFNALPMPSPNTAAFLNMVTNSTPIGDDNEALNGPVEVSHTQAPTAIPPHMQQQHGLTHMSNSGEQETITPNTFSALTGAVLNDMTRAAANGQPTNGPPGGAYYPHPMQPGMPGQPPIPGAPGVPGHVDYAQHSANAASQAANGLFLLSQAHQELSKREEAEGRNDPPLSGKRAPIGAILPGSAKLSGIGTKRKSDAGQGGKVPKKGKKNFVGGQSTGKDDKNIESEGDEEEEKNMMGKVETEEEKRKNFLERNRQAALKCRQRKKAWLNELQTKVEQLTVENERLQQTIGGLHEEIGRLSSILMQHRDCGLNMRPPQSAPPAVIPGPYGRGMR